MNKKSYKYIGASIICFIGANVFHSIEMHSLRDIFTFMSLLSGLMSYVINDLSEKEEEIKMLSEEHKRRDDTLLDTVGFTDSDNTIYFRFYYKGFKIHCDVYSDEKQMVFTVTKDSKTVITNTAKSIGEIKKKINLF